MLQIIFRPALLLVLLTSAACVFRRDGAPATTADGVRSGTSAPGERLADSLLKPMVLVGAGDIAGCGRETDEQTAALLDSLPGTVFTAGDNVYPDGTLDEFRRCYEPSWGRHRERTRPAPGNHEYHTRRGAGYYAYFGSRAGPEGQGYYSYDLGAWHIVALNSSASTRPGSPQERWLRADLAASTRRCTLAYWHFPRWSSGPHGNHGGVEPLWRALYEAGAEVVIQAHDHTYERFAPMGPNGTPDPERGLRSFVVGTGGARLYPLLRRTRGSEFRFNDAHGVIRLVLHPDRYEWSFRAVARATPIDSGSGGCH